MVNFHLNGDIVRCPDISAAKKREYERRDDKRICIYNIHEDKCQVWQNSLMNWQTVKNNSDFYIESGNKYLTNKSVTCGRCMFSGSDICPGHQAQKKTGNLKKNFKIDNVNYRKMASAAHDLVKSSQTKTVFLTLTFPSFKIEPNEKQINECFSKFAENLRANYGCSGYVAVREFGGDTHRVHFHILCAIPFTSFIDLNNAWNHAISDICEYSSCALRTTKETLFIRNPGKALRYVCKYFAKSKYQVSETRLIFMSNNLIKKPIRKIIYLPDLLKNYKGVYINKTSDFSTMFRITNPDEFMRFCNEFLYEAFENDYKYPLFNKKMNAFFSPGNG